MNTRRYFQSVVLVLCASFIGPVAAKQKQGHSADLDIAKIEQMTGLKGTLDKNENMFRINRPGSNLNVTVADVKIIGRQRHNGRRNIQEGGGRTFCFDFH